MSEELKQEDQQEVVSTVEQDDAAFESGFAEARGEEPPTPEPEPEQAEPEQAAAPEAAPEPEVVFAGLTEDQLKSALAKVGELDEMKVQLRQAFGKLGEFNARLQQAQTASGGKMSAGQLVKLRAEFPEMADLLEADLSSLSVGGNAPSFDPTPMREEMQHEFKAELDRIERKNEMKLLSMRHRDWETVRQSDDFRLWENTLPTEERQALNDSWDAMFIADKFDEYKSWREKAQTSKQQKQDRLAAAVTPRGVPNAKPSTINDDDAFMSGFKAVRRG